MKVNQGSSGVDVITIEDIEAGGVNRYLIGIQLELKSGAYKPLPVRRVMIPKPDGSQRPLGIPCVKDRIVQMAKIQEMCGFTKQQARAVIDLYMKSGLYIAEIVKRLYQSGEMKKQFPDNKERLKHIFEKQVYGLAPTEIIYKIATSYILGFDEDTKDIKHNFKQLDALPYAKDGTLEQVLDELYPEQE